MTVDDAYAGLRVLDLGQGIAAPYCAMLLAMHGAEVIKVEPIGGDWSRGLGTAYGDHTAMSAHYNRGKRSLALDLKAPAAREIALDLAKRADIVIENNRPGVMTRLGLGYPALSVLNPRLVYVSISGFGQEGPNVALPCTDSVAQAYSGMAAINIGGDGAPHRIGTTIIDALTGLYAAQAVGPALYARERKGVGRRIAVSLATFATRAVNAEPIFAELRALIAAETTASCLAKLRAADILADRINGFDDWLVDPHIVATGGAVPVAPHGMPAFKAPRTPGISPEADTALSPAPRVGEHGREILAGLGLDGSAIERLIAERAVALP
jgi:crotonobetainyl-CoA:carnitine CoA-transferase CaiB-like acyl-CoA transferase